MTTNDNARFDDGINNGPAPTEIFNRDHDSIGFPRSSDTMTLMHFAPG